jgi:hypothetical protein
MPCSGIGALGITRTPSRADPLTETPIFYAVRTAQTPIFHALLTGVTIGRPDTPPSDDPIRQTRGRPNDPTAPDCGDPMTMPIPVPIQHSSRPGTPAFPRPRPAPQQPEGEPEREEPHRNGRHHLTP